MPTSSREDFVNGLLSGANLDGADTTGTSLERKSRG